MLKIMDCESDSGGVIAKLEGQICGPGVDVVRTYCEQARENESMLTLDMKEISFLDSDAIALLRQLTGRGVRLVNMTPFLNELLKQYGF